MNNLFPYRTKTYSLGRNFAIISNLVDIIPAGRDDRAGVRSSRTRNVARGARRVRGCPGCRAGRIGARRGEQVGIVIAFASLVVTAQLTGRGRVEPSERPWIDNGSC